MNHKVPRFQNLRRRMVVISVGALLVVGLLLVPSASGAGQSSSPAGVQKHSSVQKHSKHAERYAKHHDKIIAKLCQLFEKIRERHPKFPPPKGIICPPASP